jgi:hypothetical protein
MNPTFILLSSASPSFTSIWNIKHNYSLFSFNLVGIVMGTNNLERRSSRTGWWRKMGTYHARAKKCEQSFRHKTRRNYDTSWNTKAYIMWTILKRILKKLDKRMNVGFMWLKGVGRGLVAGSCKHGNGSYVWVGIRTDWGLEAGDRFPSGKRFFSSLAQRLYHSWSPHPASYTVGNFANLGVNWPGHEADYSPTSTAEAKNGEAIPPLPVAWCIIN